MGPVNDTTKIERRFKVRFPLQLKVRYRTVGPKSQVNGFGQTINMSSRGLLVSALQDVRVGLRLKVNIEWPYFLNGGIPLQLVAIGKVVRSLRSTFAVSFLGYEFRTCPGC